MSAAEGKKEQSSLNGALLLAHPALEEQNFRRTVIFVSAHSLHAGAIGVIMNRPTGQTLSQLFPDDDWGKLGPVEVFQGGPVAPNKLLLTAWKWEAEGEEPQVFFGLSTEQARELIATGAPVLLRAFLGYAGWSPSQLEQEIASSSWVLQAMTPEALCGDSGEELWGRLFPEELLRRPWEDLLNPPEYPELN